jgi:predicted DNA binding protein
MFGLKRYKIRTSYNDIVRPGIQRIFQDIEYVIVQQQFTTSPKEFLVLCEVNWKKKVADPHEKLLEINKDIEWFDEVMTISSDKKSTLCFAKGIYDPRYTEVFMYTIKEFQCFLEYPTIAREDYGYINMVGPPKDVKRLIEFLKNWGSGLEIIAVKDYYTRDRGILTVLTDRQLEVMKTAYDLGFFERPKKMDSRDIAYKMGISHTTFLAHIRKSEKRILSALLGA